MANSRHFPPGDFTNNMDQIRQLLGEIETGLRERLSTQMTEQFAALRTQISSGSEQQRIDHDNLVKLQVTTDMVIMELRGMRTDVESKHRENQITYKQLEERLQRDVEKKHSDSQSTYKQLEERLHKDMESKHQANSAAIKIVEDKTNALENAKAQIWTVASLLAIFIPIAVSIAMHLWGSKP